MSPLQHFWSLSVEEQFYFLWPLLVIGATLLARRSGAPLRLTLAIAAALVIAASFAVALHQSLAQPTAAYFSTVTRGWELALGCLLACAGPVTRRLPEAMRTPLAWSGLAALCFSVFALNTSSVFPAPGALIPTFATAAILLAGENRHPTDIYPLTNRASIWIGNLSYSLYLWHFPVLILLEAVLPDRGLRYQVLALILIAVLSLLSYHFVEDPLRRATWRRWRNPRGVKASAPRPKRWLAPAALGLTAVCVSAFAVQTRPEVDLRTIDLAGIGAPLISSPDLQLQHDRVRDALDASAWPTLSPAVMSPGVNAQAPEWIDDGCLGDERHALPDVFKNALRCVYGNPSAGHTLALLGDSHAISYLPGVRAALGTDWRIEVYTVEECPAVWVGVNRGDGAPHPDCARFQQEVAMHLRAEHPDVIMLTSASVALTQLTSHASGAALSGEWEQGTSHALRELAPSTDRLVLVDDVPPTANLTTCYTALNGPGRCVSPVNEYYLQMVRAQRAAVASLDLPNVHYPSTVDWYCSAQGLCPSFIGHVPVSVDGFHLADAQARQLAPLIRQALQGN